MQVLLISRHRSLSKLALQKILEIRPVQLTVSMSKNIPQSESICYRLTFKSSSYSQDLIGYLQCSNSCLSGRQQVEQIVEIFLLPLVLSPEDPNFRPIVVECLSKLKSQIEVIQVLTGISLFNNLPALDVATSSPPLELPNHQVLTQQHQSSIAAEPEPQASPLIDLEAVIADFRKQLAAGIDPLTITQSLSKIQPEVEELWTEEMWLQYDDFYDEVSQLEYEQNFNPKTSTKA